MDTRGKAALAKEFRRLVHESERAEAVGASWCGDKLRGFAFLNHDAIAAALTEWARLPHTAEEAIDRVEDEDGL